MIKYDQSILQSQTGTKMVKLIIRLHKEMTYWHKATISQFKDDPNYVKPDIVEDNEFDSLSERVKMLKKNHHKALNSLKGFRGKTHNEQVKYMYSEARRDRYKSAH